MLPTARLHGAPDGLEVSSGTLSGTETTAAPGPDGPCVEADDYRGQSQPKAPAASRPYEPVEASKPARWPPSARLCSVERVEVLAGPARLSLDEIRRRVGDYLSGTAVIRAMLFGSYARGEADAFSDVDLVLIEPTTLPFVERGLRHLPLFELGVGLDLLVYTPEEWERLRRERNPLAERVEREGIAVYERPGS